MIKKGDTLVEVTIAIGIFSLIAIAVASVMSSGTAGAQLALETTLAREEIDTQADAIRFIHATYTANKDSKDHPYVKLWRELTKKAIDISDSGFSENGEKIASVLQYTPSSCSELYDSSSLALKSAFVINPRQFNTLTDNIGTTNYDISKVLFTYASNNSKFTQASTYPRLIFGNTTTNLADNTFPNTLNRAEGIYVVPVVDPQSTQIVDVIEQEDAVDKAAYFDFYIRTCWYGSRTDDPSTISTVIRLHDPDAVFAGGFFDVEYSGFNPGIQSKEIKNRNNIRKEDLPKPTAPAGWTFAGWCDGTVSAPNSTTGKVKCNGTEYSGDVLINPEKTHTVFKLVAMFDHTPYKIMYDLTGGASDRIREYNHNDPTYRICWLDVDNCRAETANTSSDPPDPHKMGGLFNGWCVNGDVNSEGSCVNGGTKIDAGGRIDNTKLKEYAHGGSTVILKAIWNKWNENYQVRLTWGEHPTDLDSHVRGQKSDNTVFHAYYSHKIGSDIDNTTIASLDRDVTTGKGPETFVLNTLGGKNYYYYVRCYRDTGTSVYGCNVTGATVELFRNGTKIGTYYSDSATDTGSAWLIFANRNGKTTFCNKRTNTILDESNTFNSTTIDNYFDSQCPAT